MENINRYSQEFQTSRKKMGKGKWVWSCTLGNKVNVMYWAEVRVCVLSHIWLFATLWTVAYQVPLSIRFPRQGNWSGLPFPTPGDLLNPEIKPESPASPALAGRFFTTEPAGKPLIQPVDFLDHRKPVSRETKTKENWEKQFWRNENYARTKKKKFFFFTETIRFRD